MIFDTNVPFTGMQALPAWMMSMDAAGTDKALLCAGLEGTRYPGGEALYGIGNAETAKAVAQHPDRLIGCMTLDPRDPGATGEMARYAGMGFRAVKLFPAQGYDIDDPVFNPFFERMEALGLHALVQMGLGGFALQDGDGVRRAPRSAFGYPMKLDPVCRLFPNISFIVLDMGYPLMMEAFSVHHGNKNIVLQMGGAGTRMTAPLMAYAALGGAGFIPLDFSRVVFGSALGGEGCATLAQGWLPLLGCPSGMAEAVMGGNAAALFCGEKSA